MILIIAIDDDLVWRELMEQSIIDAGGENYRIYSSPSEFISACNQDVYIALIDHKLGGGIQGIDILRSIKTKSPDCMSIILSATDDAKVVIEYTNEGVYKWVVKNPDTAQENMTNYIKDALILAKKIEYRNGLIKRLTN